MNYQFLVQLAKDGDPLIVNNKYEITPDGLIIYGECTKDAYSDDFKIRIEGSNFRIWVRDSEPDQHCKEHPEDLIVELPMWGREWTGEYLCLTYQELVQVIYEF